MAAVTRRPHELEVGDRILGTQLVIADRYGYSQGDIGGDRERQRYTYPLTNGRSITYTGDSPGVSVIPEATA